MCGNEKGESICSVMLELKGLGQHFTSQLRLPSFMVRLRHTYEEDQCSSLLRFQSVNSDLLGKILTDQRMTHKQPGSLSKDEGNGNTVENNQVNEQKQQLCTLCTCVLHVGTFLCRPVQNNVK